MRNRLRFRAAGTAARRCPFFPRKTSGLLSANIGLACWLSRNRVARNRPRRHERPARRQAARGPWLSIVRVRDRAPSPSPDGNAPVMSLDAGRAGAASHTANDACRSFAPGRPRAEISPPARRPAGTFLPSAPCERGARAPANAPERHRRLAVFRSDDFDREPRRAMAHAGIRFARRCGGHPVAPPPDMVRRRSIRARRGPCACAATKPERSRSSDCQKAADYTGHDGREAHGTAQFLAEKRLPRVGRNRGETGARRPFPMRKRIIPHTQTLPPRSAHRRARFQRRQAPRAATKRLAA
ncbi:Uncharacterised protein [Burkholderia pseudomallei]|nr:Uncharacterised protein [Burkholderia pseudomallei]CAK0097790.1 Uncharacterised protein [Burkholderia pseudomallei]CAK0259980.1 Uncharacterised protein [Burkholderia pseudomallei]